jgi:uncharacterized protein affecting Mg2+/Co2+ transport
MPTFRGKLMRDGREVIPAVAGEVSRQAVGGGAQEWAGELQLPAGTGIMPGVYQLVRDDGQEVSIAVAGASHDNRGRSETAFKVMGEWP